jgi:hypothetical protein
MGVSVLPCFLGDPEPLLRRFGEVLAARDLWLIANPQAARVARVRAVKEFVTSAIEREMRTLRGDLGE